MKYATAIHRCCCGCGNEVVTPLSPVGWFLTFDGDSISLDPSIGNWNFPCRSHYWITRNKVRSASPWSERKIEASRAREHAAKVKYFHEVDMNVDAQPKSTATHRENRATSQMTSRQPPHLIGSECTRSLARNRQRGTAHDR